MIALVIRARLCKLALENCIDVGRFDRRLSLAIDHVVVEVEALSA
jgi:hypothetical protein